MIRILFFKKGDMCIIGVSNVFIKKISRAKVVCLLPHITPWCRWLVCKTYGTTVLPIIHCLLTKERIPCCSHSISCPFAFIFRILRNICSVSGRGIELSLTSVIPFSYLSQYKKLVSNIWSSKGLILSL